MKYESIDALYMSAYPAFALLAAIQLDLFSALAQGAAGAEQIAARLEVAPGRLAVLLQALVVAGVVEKSGERYSNGAEAHRMLVKGRPDFLEGIGELYLDRYRAALGAAQSIRDDRPSAKKDFASMKPPEAAAYYAGMFKRAVDVGVELARRFDFAGCRSVLDAGGGSGGLAAGLCRVLPELHVTVADLPPVLPIARARIAESGLADRVHVLEADVLAAPPPGVYDAAVVRSLLQVMSAPDAGRALANIVAAVKPGGPVYVLGRVLDDSGLSPEECVFYNVVFISLYQDGRAYTERQYREWFRGAGIGGVRRIPLAGGHSILWGRKEG
ncbi:MAG: methyltransferase domain-containing protein [Betaproteobacteria bacterium]|nr:methyltransferase domain-containing protein [Betaproteobacteria bacterium]